VFAFLVRVILFSIALSVIRSVITRVQRALGIGIRRSPAPVRGSPQPSSTGATMLQQDPVCGTYVAVDASLKRVVKGKVLHFCSPECRDKYAV
jgi:YHS domain-containing protein